VVVIALAVTAAGCGGSSSKAEPGATTVAMKLSDKGCSPAAVSIPAGPVTFNVSNEGSSKVTEFELKNDKGVILGERENIVEGIDGSFSLTLQPGTYVLSCPNGDPDDVGVLTATGKRTTPTVTVSAAPLARATAAYHGYVVSQSAKLLAGTKTFVAALALNEYIQHTTSALFAIPPGTQPGDFVGSGLFA
jgi:iron uptake system component EfeO